MKCDILKTFKAHPDKVLAKELNTNFPSIYKDSNHKPEMAIALTPFEALCGFRQPNEINLALTNYHELTDLIGLEVAEKFKLVSTQAFDDSSLHSLYKEFFHSFMAASDEIAHIQVNKLIARLNILSTKSIIDEVILRLNQDYPNDRGIFCPLILNYLTLAPGESFFMGPNEPHAYLSGDCIECMALSDNVVRAGLTPKFRDVETLCRMLHYKNGTPSILSPIVLDPYRLLYR